MKKLMSLTVAILLLTMGTNAQTKFEKETTDASKLIKKVKRDFPIERGKNGGGYAPYYPALETPPKKVALVTFAVFDPGYTETKKTDQAYTTTYNFKTVRNSNENMNAMLNGWYNLGLEPLKKSFESYGMELLTPDQFLDTDEKKDAYKNFEFEGKKSEFWNKTSSGGTQEDVEACVLPEGFKEFIPKYREVFNKENTSAELYNNCGEFKKKEIYNALGYDLCKVLDVDAVLVVNNTVMTKDKITTVKKIPVLMGVDMYMFGPNPIQISAGEKEPMVYRKGNFYGGYTLYFTSPVMDKKNMGAGVSTAGYDNVMTAMANVMGEWLKEQTAKPDKRK